MTETLTWRRLSSGDAHLTFAAMLHTLAEPGTVELLPTGPLGDDLAAVALPVLALADVEVTVCVDGDATHPLATALARTVGASVEEAESADIVVFTVPDPELVSRCRRGSALAPELGARLIVRVDDIVPSGPGDVTLLATGPGIPGQRVIGLTGVTPDFVRAIGEANRAFPAGVDTWFVTDDGRICALSRSTRFTLEES